MSMAREGRDVLAHTLALERISSVQMLLCCAVSQGKEISMALDKLDEVCVLILKSKEKALDC